MPTIAPVGSSRTLSPMSRIAERRCSPSATHRYDARDLPARAKFLVEALFGRGSAVKVSTVARAAGDETRTRDIRLGRLASVEFGQSPYLRAHPSEAGRGFDLRRR
jgi:hypothetical protein